MVENSAMHLLIMFSQIRTCFVPSTSIALHIARMLLLSATVAFLNLSSPAVADEGFKGPWVAVLGGYDSTELPFDDGPEAMYGMATGYNWLRGRWVLGVEGEISTSNASKQSTDYYIPGDKIDVRYGRDVLLSVRGGRMLAKNFLVYGKGGYANTLLKTRYDGPPELDRKFGRDGAIFGFMVGGGFEYHLEERWLTKLEYRYSNFHDGIYRHQAVAGIGLQF